MQTVFFMAECIDVAKPFFCQNREICFIDCKKGKDRVQY